MCGYCKPEGSWKCFALGFVLQGQLVLLNCNNVKHLILEWRDTRPRLFVVALPYQKRLHFQHNPCYPENYVTEVGRDGLAKIIQAPVLQHMLMLIAMVSELRWLCCQMKWVYLTRHKEKQSDRNFWEEKGFICQSSWSSKGVWLKATCPGSTGLVIWWNWNMAEHLWRVDHIMTERVSRSVWLLQPKISENYHLRKHP